MLHKLIPDQEEEKLRVSERVLPLNRHDEDEWEETTSNALYSSLVSFLRALVHEQSSVVDAEQSAQSSFKRTKLLS